MQQLGIEMIPAYSPEARGRSERMFRTHQDRLTKELAANNITTMEAANLYLKKIYQPAFNKEFRQEALEKGSAFVPWIGTHIEDTLCEHHERRLLPIIVSALRVKPYRFLPTSIVVITSG